MHNLSLFAGWSDVPIELAILSLAIFALPIFIIWGIIAGIQKGFRSPQEFDTMKSQQEPDSAENQQSTPGRVVSIEKPRTPAWKITFMVIMGTYIVLAIVLVVTALLAS